MANLTTVQRLVASPATVSGSGVVNSSSGLTMAATIYYVDSSGVQQVVDVVDGVTSINIDQYQCIYVDCSDTRSDQPDGNAFGKAWATIGFRVNWGESLGTTWPYPEGINPSRDEDLGSAGFARVFTTTGSKTVRIKGKDSAGQEATISFTVVVAALGTPVVASTGGSWSISNGDVIGLTYGLDYSSKSGLAAQLSGKRNVVFIAVGTPGALPILGTVNFDNRTNVDTPGVVRSSNIRLINVDSAVLTWDGVGCSFCGAYGGRVRSVAPGIAGFNYAETVRNATGATRANNIRYPRGFFLHDTGELNESPGEKYCWIGAAGMASFQGVDMNRTTTGGGGSPEHIIRPYVPWLLMRYNRLRTQVTIISYLKGSADGCVYSELPDTLDRDFDIVGDYDADRSIYTTWNPTYNGELVYGYARPAHNCIVEYNQVGSAESLGLVALGWGPQNNDPQDAWPPSRFDHSKEAFETCSIQNNYWYETVSDQDIHLGGRYLVARNNLLNMGAGGLVGVGTGFGSNRLPVGYNNDYYTTGVLPVPSAF